MGAKNPDRLPLVVFRSKSETVVEMMAEHWSVIAKCPECGLAMDVDLQLIAKVAGPATSLSNRRQKCRRIGCSGVMRFYGRHPKRNGHEELQAPWPEGRPPASKAGQ